MHPHTTLVCALMCHASICFGQFSKDDQIRLSRDEQLLFNNSPYRMGRKGETFTVLQYKADQRRIFLLTTDSAGKPFAVAVPDSAATLVPQFPSSLLLKGIESLRQSNWAEAERQFQAAGSRIGSPPILSHLSTQSGVLGKRVAAVNDARLREEKSKAQIEQKKRNAQVVNRPNRLTADSSNQSRSADILREAVDAEKQLRAAVQTAEKQLAEAISTTAETLRELESTKYYSAALALHDALKELLQKQLPGNREKVQLPILDRTSLLKRIGLADAETVNARNLISGQKLIEALGSVDAGLEAEPTNAVLLTLRSDISLSLQEVEKMLSEATKQQEAKQWEASLQLLQTASSQCRDHSTVATALKLSEKTVKEKAEQLLQAKGFESTSESTRALAIYEKYDLKGDIARILPVAAKAQEASGSFLNARDLYRRAGLSDDAVRLQKLCDEQTVSYATARIAVIEGRFDEALAILEKYKDVEGKKGVLRKQAAFMEGKGQFDQALQIYRTIQDENELQRLVDFLSKREANKAEGNRAEQAGNLTRALELFVAADDHESVTRVATTLAKQFEAGKDYEQAADYFERAGNFKEAARVRAVIIANSALPDSSLTAKDVFRRCSAACVTVINNKENGLGSGFFFAPEGYVMTNNHVVDGAKTLTVLDSKGREYRAKVISSSKVPDLAILKTEIGPHPILKFDDSDKVETGSRVFAIGSPKGLPQTLNDGIVSNKDREPSFAVGNRCFQINVLINHGDSGGPLINEKGRVVGINSFGSGTLTVLDGVAIGSDVQGINYAIRINESLPLIQKALPGFKSRP